MTKRSIALRWAAVLTVVIAGLCVLPYVHVKDDALDLLPGDAVKQDIRLLQRMGLVDRLFITLQRPVTMEASRFQQAVSRFAEELRKSGRCRFVLARLPVDSDRQLFSTLHASLPLLLDQQDLQRVRERIEPAALAKSMEQLFSMLNSPAGIAMKQRIQQDPLGLTTLVLQKLEYLRSEFSMRLQDGFFVSEDGHSYLLLAESKGSLTASDTADELAALLRSIADDTLPSDSSMRIIGSLPHTQANSRIIKNDLRWLVPTASILLVALLGFTLRNIRALVVFAIPFLAASPAIALASLYHSQLSRLALGFGVVLLGIGVDFSVHLYLALRWEKGTPAEILARMRRPILFASLTTVGVFMVLLFSQVSSHRQMALLALSGIVLAVLFAWLLIPTIAGTAEGKDVTWRGIKWAKPGGRKSVPLIILWLMLMVAGLLAWPQLRYNGDLRVLDVQDEKVVGDEKIFKATWGEKGEQAFVLAQADTMTELLDQNFRVYERLVQHGATSFQSFAPILPGPEAQGKNLAGWQNFWQTHMDEFRQSFSEAALARGFSDTAFQPFFSWLEKTPQTLEPEQLLDGALRPLLMSLLKIPGTSVSDDRYLALTTVKISQKSEPLLKSLGEQADAITVLSNSSWKATVERQLRHDIVSLSLIAGLVIIILVGIQFRNPVQIVAVLAPVLAALAAMSLFCFFSGSSLNTMHLIMGIMVIGLSVDYGIFIVCSVLGEQSRVSFQAVSICAASSLIGFGVLAFGHHPALHSLGVTVLVGIGVAWPTAVWISPAILDIFSFWKKGLIAVVVLLGLGGCASVPVPTISFTSARILPDEGLLKMQISSWGKERFNGLLGIQQESTMLSFVILDPSGLTLAQARVDMENGGNIIFSSGVLKDSSLVPFLATALRRLQQVLPKGSACLDDGMRRLCREDADMQGMRESFGPLTIWRSRIKQTTTSENVYYYTQPWLGLELTVTSVEGKDDVEK